MTEKKAGPGAQPRPIFSLFFSMQIVEGAVCLLVQAEARSAKLLGVLVSQQEVLPGVLCAKSIVKLWRRERERERESERESEREREREREGE